MKKYFDIAKTDNVFIQRGKTETFLLSMEKHLLPDDDLAKAISLDELFDGVKSHIHTIFKEGKNENSVFAGSSAIS
ncbi:MAG: hypothetical protein LBB73_05775 [Dysgonamonadaceae bacterium]|nr:hypothetical protein [Dysgonamonadaceae bacterium]